MSISERNLILFKNNLSAATSKWVLNMYLRELFCKLVVQSSENQEAPLIPLINHVTGILVQISTVLEQMGTKENISPTIFTVSRAGCISSRVTLQFASLYHLAPRCSMQQRSSMVRASRILHAYRKRDASMAVRRLAMENKRGIDSPPGKIRASLPG